MGTEESKLKCKDLESLRLDTEFTNEEIKEWYRWCKDFANCPSGRVDMDKFKIIYSRLFPSGVDDNYVEHVFRSFDTNEDRHVDFREFMISLSITSRGTLEQKLEWAFKVYDINGDGFITQKEMVEVLWATDKVMNSQNLEEDQARSWTRVDEIFKHLDTNGDGKLSMTEFVEWSTNDPGIVYELLQINRRSAKYSKNIRIQ